MNYEQFREKYTALVGTGVEIWGRLDDLLDPKSLINRGRSHVPDHALYVHEFHRLAQVEQVLDGVDKGDYRAFADRAALLGPDWAGL